MSVLFLRLFFAVMGCALFSAEGDVRPAGVQIVHYPSGGGAPFYALFFDDEEIEYQGLSEKKTKNLFKSLREFVLAGYRLHSDIKETVLCDDRAFQAGVRELISYTEPFYSEELKSLFTQMAPLVDKGGVYLNYPGRGKKMPPGYIAKWVYPEGFTREWTVIDKEQAKKPTKYDRVCIAFAGEPVVLEGRLQERGCIEDGGPPEGSLLFIKKRLDPHVQNIEEQPNLTEAFFDGMWRAGYVAHATNYVGCILWSREGISSVVNVSESTMSAFLQGLSFTFSHPEVPFTLSLPMIMRGWWKNVGLWRGYAFKHPASCTVDFSALESVSMRKAVCYTQEFVSEDLQKALATTLKNTEPQGGGQEKNQNALDEAEYLSPQHQTFLWTVVEDELFLQKFLNAIKIGDQQTSEEMLPDGGVLCVMRADRAFLKGVPMPKDYAVKSEDSLGSAWIKRVLHEEKGCCAFKIAAQEEYVGCTGVQIVHRPPLGFCPSYVAFSKTQEIVCKRGLRQETKNLYQELQEFLLAGYHVHAGIDEKDVCDDSFFQAGVRELISHSEPFDSGELRTLFTRIAKFVDAGEGLTLENPGRWKKMDPGYISECIYPEGLTRQWRVVDEKHIKNISMFDRVFDRVLIAFAGEKVVLEGRLCERGTTHEGLSERSLLSIKRRGFSEKPPRPLAEQKVPVEKFFLLQDSDCDTALLLYKGGDKLSGLFSPPMNIALTCEYDKSVCPVNATMKRILKCMVLDGFVLKYPERCFVDTDALITPKVRKVACDKRAFTSYMQKSLYAYKTLLGNMRMGQDSRFNPITREDLGSLHPVRQKLLWTVEEDEGFIEDLLLNRHLESLTRGTVFCLIRGETAILQGVPVPQKYKVKERDTLLGQWNKNIVLDNKNRGF